MDEIDIFSISDLITIVISKDDVQSLNIEPTLSVLKNFIETPKKAKQSMERLSIGFHGYDQDMRELYEIPEIRDFVHKLDKGFPYWLFFLSKKTLGLQCIMWCFLLPYLNENVRNEIHLKKLDELLTKLWFPAMNHVGNYAGLSDYEIDTLTENVLKYLTKGTGLHESNI
jgi:hypothetical protein